MWICKDKPFRQTFDLTPVVFCYFCRESASWSLLCCTTSSAHLFRGCSSKDCTCIAGSEKRGTLTLAKCPSTTSWGGVSDDNVFTWTCHHAVYVSTWHSIRHYIQCRKEERENQSLFKFKLKNVLGNETICIFNGIIFFFQDALQL